MSGFTLFDYIYIVVSLGSIIWAFFRGGVYELVAAMSWLIAAVSSRFISPAINNFMIGAFGLKESTIGTLTASYFIVFFAVLVLFGLFNQKLRDWVQDSVLVITDRTLGVIFGGLRAVVVMGLFYWGALWYYQNAEKKPDFLTGAKTRPMMQVAANKIHDWFVPGKNEILEMDKKDAPGSDEMYNNLIDPVIKAAEKPAAANPEKENEGTGYKDSERDALDNQLLQIDAATGLE